MSAHSALSTQHSALSIFGIRHHGPGCARSLLAALTALEPDIVLVEGPPDAADVLPLITHEALKPPVALLVYAPDRPQLAAFYPFTHYSPEWQALRYALGRGIPARFMDLPQALRLGRGEEGRGEAESQIAAPDAPSLIPSSPLPSSPLPAVPDDPIGTLAEAAGYTDHELWWEHQIEQRRDATDLFAGIMEAMT